MLSKDENWHKVSLRLFGEGVDPAEVTAVLDLEPSYSARTGEHIQQNPRYAVHHTNIWTHGVTSDPVIPFPEQIDPLLDYLETRSGFAGLFAQPDVEAELLLGFSTGRGLGSHVFFPPPLLVRVGALGLGINLDLYPPSPSLALRRYEKTRSVV